MKVVNLDTYDVLIGKGILEKSCEYIEKILPSDKYKKCIIITDKNVDKIGYSDIILKSLSNNYVCEKIIILPGERSKSFSTFQNTAEKILDFDLNRNCFLIAVGGGVVGDLTGFLASTLLRGIPFVQVPTTLLSQVDSSIGGKTGINSKNGKNLIGSFYQPSLVLIDLNVLNTLDMSNLKSGYSEIFKIGLIGDEKFFEYCEKYAKFAILDKNFDYLEFMIKKSCEFKAEIVKRDPFEKNDIRVLLNLGHTFAHVYEKMVKYNEKKILHGEAVGVGILQAFQFSQELGLIKNDDVNRVLNHINDLKLFNFDDLKKFKEYQEIDDFVKYMLTNMKKDKKSDYQKYNLVLNKKIGQSIFVRDIDLDKLKNFFSKI